jgi:glucoamylase
MRPLNVTRLDRRSTGLAERVAAVLLGLAVFVAAGAGAAGRAVAAGVAPGGPGAPSYFDLARKDCLGTAAGTRSKVWFTVADGVLSDVYEPTIDNTNVSTLQYIVTDGATFTDLQTRDMSYTVAADRTGMACTVTSTDAQHGFRLVTTYITDPARDTVLMRTRLEDVPGSSTKLGSLRLYARLDAHVNGNGGGGSQNAGANSGVVDASGIPVIFSTNTATNAVNRDYAVPTYMALAARPAPSAASVGYAGTASDGLTQLDTTHALTTYSSAPDGHVVATEEVARAGRPVVLALGFGRTQAGSVSVAARSLSDRFGRTAVEYRHGWTAYDAGLNRPPRIFPGLTRSQAASLDRHYWLSANVLRASADKTFPGAIVASLASPWGQAVPAGVLAGGEPSYFGSYREVFARDLYEAFTGLLADGDIATARAAI